MYSNWKRVLTAIAICAALTCSIAGCGDQTATVVLEGNVTIDGIAVNKGVVNFTSKDKGASSTATAEISAGSYRAEVPTGPAHVFFHATRETGKTVDVFGKQQPETVNMIPLRYRSGLAIDIPASDSQHNFDLKSK